jgi:hypothetical protein
MRNSKGLWMRCTRPRERASRRGTPHLPPYWNYVARSFYLLRSTRSSDQPESRQPLVFQRSELLGGDAIVIGDSEDIHDKVAAAVDALMTARSPSGQEPSNSMDVSMTYRMKWVELDPIIRKSLTACLSGVRAVPPEDHPEFGFGVGMQVYLLGRKGTHSARQRR